MTFIYFSRHGWKTATRSQGFNQQYIRDNQKHATCLLVREKALHLLIFGKKNPEATLFFPDQFNKVIIGKIPKKSRLLSIFQKYENTKENFN